jgi:hypothetical protein
LGTVLYENISILIDEGFLSEFLTSRGPTAHRTVVDVFNFQSDQPGAQ